MSSIKKEGGVYTYYARVNKRQVHRSLHTGDYRLALTRKKQLDDEVLVARWKETHVTFAEFQVRYNAWSLVHKSKETASSEATALRRAAELLKPELLSSVTHLRADEMITRIASKGSKATADFYRRTLKSVFNRAVEWKMIEENPFKGIRELDYQLPPVRVLNRDELQRLFVAVADLTPQLLPAITFALLTGMRRSEIVRLEWLDIDWDRNVITVRKTKSKHPRYLPLAPLARRILEVRKEQGLGRPFPVDADALSHAFHAAAVKAGITNATLHDLRRTFATMLGGLGISGLFIQQWLGHSDRSVTEDFYTGIPEDTSNRLAGLSQFIPKFPII